MPADLAVTQLVEVYRNTSYTWARPVAYPRATNGFVFFTEGSISYDFEGIHCTAGPGDLLLLPKQVPYSGKKLTHHCSYYVVDFELDGPPLLEQLSLDYVTHVPNPNKLRAALEQLLESWNSASSSRLLRCKGEFYRILADLLQSLEPSRPEQVPLMAAAAEYIQSHCEDSELSVPHLCRRFHISESQLRRLFQQQHGCSPVQYIRRARIRQACGMMLRDDMSLGEIALRCGFASAYYFSRVFREEMGCSPSQYRHQNL